MDLVPAVLEEALDEFADGLRPASRRSVHRRAHGGRGHRSGRLQHDGAHRAGGRRGAAARPESSVGLVKVKLFRPFLRERVRAGHRLRRAASRSSTATTRRGPGGIFWTEVATSLRSRSDIVVQDYIVGLGGGDVTPAVHRWHRRRRAQRGGVRRPRLHPRRWRYEHRGSCG